MSEQPQTQSYEQTPDREDQLDQDQLQPYNNLDDRGVADALDEGYSPPEKPSALLREGPHETLDERLAEEVPEPDPYAEPEVAPDNLTEQADFIADGESDFVDDGEVGDVRAGRLIDPNAGIGPDEDKELIGEDAGIDAGAASAEEAAIHIVPDDQP
ncbi:DUF5709 domain-containing protein [uncultured Friedmanniella sp.]|uniref:DUF5709 domain-containing protein n=1 Tax=uncultured Friedmanniella sp. TaxID=335381 RepID=UPI0035CB28F6